MTIYSYSDYIKIVRIMLEPFFQRENHSQREKQANVQTIRHSSSAVNVLPFVILEVILYISCTGARGVLDVQTSFLI